MRADWVECKLGEVSNLITKGATPTTYGFKFQNQGINFLKVENVKGGRVDLKSIINFISEDAHEYQKKSQLEVNDILFSIAGTIGNTCLIKAEYLPANTNQAFAIIRGTQDILLPAFLVFQLNSFVEKLKILSRGGAMLNVSLQDLKEFNTLIPPLPEQRAIVKKIEALFSSLDAGIADLKKAQDQLKTYRQAVLKKAFEGENTWIKTKIKDIIKTIDGDRGKNYPKKQDFFKEEYCLFLSTKNVRNGKFLFEENQFISKEKDDILNAGKLERGDIVLTTRGTLGNVALYDSSVKYNNIRINSGMLILRILNEQELDPKYLMNFINSPIFFDQLKSKQTGTAQPQIPANILKEIIIGFPNSKEEQAQIVKEIEARLSVCDAVEQQIKDSLSQAEALRQSILKKAFEGKLLTEEEIKACQQEPDYEPASALLEKIKAEKEAPKTKMLKKQLNIKNSFKP